MGFFEVFVEDKDGVFVVQWEKGRVKSKRYKMFGKESKWRLKEKERDN